MPSEQNYHLSRRPSARTASLAHEQKQPNHHILTIGMYLLAGAIVALGLANLPAWTGSLLTVLNVLPTHLT
jgi:hypothetical protein